MKLSNKTKYILTYALSSVSFLFITENILQAFLGRLGIPTNKISLYLAIMDILIAGVTFLLTFLIDRFKNILKLYSWISLSNLILIAALVFFCLPVSRDLSINFKFITIFITGSISNLLHAVNGVLSYKVPYHIMDISEYGDASGKGGIVVGIAGFGVSLMLTFFRSRFDYFLTMGAFFILSALGYFISFCIIRSYEKFEAVPNISVKEKQKTRINLLHYKPIYILLIPNLLRAIAEGVIGVIYNVGNHWNIISDATDAIMTTTKTIATLLGCFIFIIAIKKIRLGLVLIVSSIGLALSLPSMFLFGKTTISLSFFQLALWDLFYLITYFFVTIIQYAIPFAVTKIVDYNAIGQYTTIRILIHTLGLAIGKAMIIPLTNICGVTLAMSLVALCPIIAGAAYFIYLAKLKK